MTRRRHIAPFPRITVDNGELSQPFHQRAKSVESRIHSSAHLQKHIYIVNARWHLAYRQEEGFEVFFGCPLTKEAHLIR